ncbi:ankyrin repeat domain-containing protein [Chitinophaga pendula]|uniref:ankyrin repeat domain-containing protein n=1 Tax=Chitinophaga TaxID=79328 RepID=UPI000BAE879E|nr:MULTISPECIES: ankyrin repeat domain-containing protein [Chitinophaga]ASZ11720.1 hypothetical protein CK934_12515 [Chitinophaga sp. MD30]UCJ05260.1 ankyrin repeat domain-containing protein [Chitinophaga pendula]
MSTTAINDPLFGQALAAIDADDPAALQSLLTAHPELVTRRLDTPLEGYFRRPFLLWFLADNPIRTGSWPAKIFDITNNIITAVRQHAPGSLQFQLDYALELIATGRTARLSGKQIDLIDLLIDAGAIPNNGLSAVAQGNNEAAARLVERGASLTLPLAVGLQRTDDIIPLLQQATPTDIELAITVAAFTGKHELLQLLVKSGIDLDAFPATDSGFHSHATALHQAVQACAPQAVHLLVTAGANTSIIDLVYQGTPLDWAIHFEQTNANNPQQKQKWKEIIQYLSEIKKSPL